MRIHSEFSDQKLDRNLSFQLYFRALLSLFHALTNWFELLVLRLFRGNRSIQAGAEKVFNELILEEQTEYHKLNNNLFFWVKHGDLNTLREKVQELLKTKGYSEEESLIDERDAAGANIIHLAYLLENYKLGRWLVEVYPFVALSPYSSDLPRQAIENKPELAMLQDMEKMMPYTGENILHMVIVRSNYEEVRWLLDFYKDHKDSVPGGLVRLLTSNAVGSFFKQDGDFYYGGYPLQFAVCSNNIEIFDLVLSFTSSLVSHGIDDSLEGGDDGEMDVSLLKDLQSLGSNVIFMRDTFGNTVLHLCVIHGLKNMYRHVYNTAETILKREIKLLYAQTIATSPTSGPFELQDLRVLEKHKSTICLGYNFKPKTLKRPRIEKFEEWVNYEARMKVEERLTFALNTDLHSPLTLAAARMSYDDHPDVAAKKVEMFTFLLHMHKTVRYEYGIVSFNTIGLLGLEVAYDYRHYGIPPEQQYRMRSAIDWMCNRMAEQAVVIPDVRKIINTKWKRCGLDFFLLDYFLNIIQVVCITLISTLINFSPTTSSSASIVEFTSFLYIVVWAIYLIMFMREGTALYRNTWKYLSTRGVPTFHIICIALQIISFILFCFFRIPRSTNNSVQSTDEESLTYSNVVGVKFCLSIALFSSWAHIYYYLMAFESTGPFMLTLARIIFVEIPNFLKFYVIVIIAFACGLALLVDNGDCGTFVGFSNVFQTIWVLVQDTLHPAITPSLQIIDLTNVSENLQWMADFLLTAYYASVNIVMLNILIAIINATYSFYTEYNTFSNTYNNEAMLLIAKYNILNYIECFFPVDRADHRRKKYCIVEHFNRDFSPFDDVDNASLKALPISDKQAVAQEYTEYLLETQEKTDYWIQTQTDSNDNKKNVQNVTVLIVCPQNDFHSGGKFPVDGANEDSRRIAKMIDNHLYQIHNIVVVLESRYQFNISHSSFWVSKADVFPRPYTVISYKDVKNKVWIPRQNTPEIYNWCLMYTKTLEQIGRRMLTIWPEHCIIGSRGHAIVPVINEALQLWATQSNRVVTYVTKGENWRTEMFSALEAEIVDPLDCTTALNSELLSMLRMSDKLIVCGQALSHAVNFTMRDLIKHWRGDMSQLVLLEDGSSPLEQPQYLKLSQEKQYTNMVKELIEDLKLEGVTMAAANNVLPVHFEDERMRARLKAIFADSNEISSSDGNVMPFNEYEHDSENDELERGCLNMIRDMISPLAGDYATKISHFLRRRAHSILYQLFGTDRYDKRVLFNEIIAEKESVLLHDSKCLFYWVLQGSLSDLKIKIRSVFKHDPDGREIYNTDATGANIIHKAYLLKLYEMGHWLVTAFPDLALKGYSDDLPDELSQDYNRSDMPYTGLTILHMVILRRDYEEVRWLLDFYKDHKYSVESGLEILLAANATGSFFSSSGDFYFGGFPLQFAVCSNSIEIFDLVLSYASSIEVAASESTVATTATVTTSGSNVIFMRDSVGNTVVHLCAIHGLKAMFQHVCKTAELIISRELKRLYSTYHDKGQKGQFYLSSDDSAAQLVNGYKIIAGKIFMPSPDKYKDWLIEETVKKLDERLLFALNKDLHSPLTLAASISRKKGDLRDNIFGDLLSSYKKPFWTYGPIVCSVIQLEGVETSYNMARFEPAFKEETFGIRSESAIRWLCLSESEECILLPEVKAYLNKKWKLFGLPLFLLDFILDSVLTLLVSFHLIFVNFSPTLHPLDSLDWFIDINYALTFVLFTAIFLVECDVMLRNHMRYFRVQGTARFHIISRAVKIISYYFFLGFQLADGTFTNQSRADDYAFNSALESPQDNRAIKLSLTVCVMISWLHGYFYLLGFESTGPFLLVLSRIVIKDLPYFAQFYVFVLLGFGCAIAMVSNGGEVDISFGFSRLFESIVGLIQKTVNISPFKTYPASVLGLEDVSEDVSWLQDVQVTLYYSIVVFILLNLLIAIMSKTFSTYSVYNEAFFLMEKYQIIEYLELHMSDAEIFHTKKAFTNKNVVEYETTAASSESSSIAFEAYNFELNEVIPDWLTSVPATADFKQYKKTSIFIIDPQVDFHPGGSLAVPGANEDSERIANMIKKNKQFIHEIFVSLDSHYPTHIAHAIFWVNDKGEHPEPFTVIRFVDVKKGVWMPKENSTEVMDWCKKYIKALERKGRMMLTIWPPHCIIGSRGHCIVPAINEALQEWAAFSHRPVTYVLKGQNCRTEMYSALEAEVVDPLDHSTALNNDLLSLLKVADRLLVCGQALSHCVNFTFRDIVKHWKGDLSRLELLEDGGSCVTGFSHVGKRLIDEMGSLGVTISTTATAFPNLDDISGDVEGDMVTAFHDFDDIQDSMRLESPVEVNATAEVTESDHPVSADKSTPAAPEVNYFDLSLFARMRSRLGKFVLDRFNHSNSDKQREFAEKIVKLQSAEHSDRTKIFHWVQIGDLTALKERLLKVTPAEIAAYDAAGANIVHLAYLFEFYHIGHWLVESYPNLALRAYSDTIPVELELEDKGYTSSMMPFTGENILHVVIVRRNYKEVRWLLDFFKDHKDSVPGGLAKLLMSNATGKFFDPSGDFYFGGYPLQFAVCSNSQEIFDLVLSFAASVESDGIVAEAEDFVTDAGNLALGPNVIFMRDAYGNTMLHLCVIHGLTDMFQHVLSIVSTILKREIQLSYSVKVTEDKLTSKSFFLPAMDHSSGFSLAESGLVIPDPNKFESWVLLSARQKIDERLLLVLNNNLQSPLTLAAALSNKITATVSKESRLQMMKTVMVSTNNKIKLWNYGPIVCFDIIMNGVDIDYDLREYKSCIQSEGGLTTAENQSAITWLCKNEDTNLILMSEIRGIIDRKWERYGLPMFVLDCLLDGIITLFVTLICIYVNTAPTMRPQFGFELFVNLLYGGTLLAFIYLTYNEASAWIRNPLYVYSIRGVAQVNVMCRLLKILTFYIFIVFRVEEASNRNWENVYFIRSDNTDHRFLSPDHFTRQLLNNNFTTSTPSSSALQFNPQDYPGSKISLSVCVVACWFNLYYYMMGFKATGPFMLTFKRVISHDVPYFMQFFFIPLFGFALCLSMLENDGTVEKNYAFWNTARTIWNLMQKSVAMNVFIDLTSLSLVPNSLQWLSNLLLTSFYGFVVLIMLNLLIAIINNTYAVWSLCDESIFLIEKCNIMDFFDKHLDTRQMIDEREKYCSIRRKVTEKGERESDSTEASKVYTMEMTEIELDWDTTKTDSFLSTRLQKTSLFIIDPQVDFHPGGSLAVPGANEDSERIANMIKKNKQFIHEIFVSLDSHYPTHIAHAIFWVNDKGEHPEPFTVIRYMDVINGVWMPKENTPQVVDWCMKYTKALERKGRVKLTIWPPHCIIGSRGHCIVPAINEALQEWAAFSHRPVTYVLKGQNCRTEMYSALEADVVDPWDSTTALNSDLVSMLIVAERILICGQALSHCVNFTLRDIVKHWRGEMSKIVLLMDGSSPVTGFERVANLFVFEMQQEGVQLATTESAFDDKESFPTTVVITETESSSKNKTTVESFDDFDDLETKDAASDQGSPGKEGITTFLDAKVERADVVFGDDVNEELLIYQFNNDSLDEQLTGNSLFTVSVMKTKFSEFLLRALDITQDNSYKNFVDELGSKNISIHNDKSKLFYFVEMGDLHALEEQIHIALHDLPTVSARNKFLKNYVDAVGANIVHLAYLMEYYHIAHWLVETFPEVALQPYSSKVPAFIGDEFKGFDMPYSGENILHIVIVRRNYVEVRWLLDFYKDHKDSVPNGLKVLLAANATGHFFDISGDFYFGGYPLQFAVCSNSIEIFDLVLSFASSLESDIDDNYNGDDAASSVLGANLPSLGPNVLFMRDTYGNTVLHLCVMHCLQDMFDHVYKVAETIISREIKLMYSKLYDVAGDQLVELESFEEKSAISTGYNLRPQLLKIPSDEKKYDEWVKGETHLKLQERLLLVLNHDLHSPLTLSAIIKESDASHKRARKLSMLKYLLKKLKTTLWTYGKEQCTEVALEGLEVKYDLSDYEIAPDSELPAHHSVLTWLCIHNVEAAIMIPEIRKIIETKWDRCGLAYYIIMFVLDFVVVTLLTLVLVYGNYVPTLFPRVGMDWFINILYASIIFIFFVLISTELMHIIRFRKLFRRVRGIAKYHTTCRLVEMLTFTVFCIAHLQREQSTTCHYGDLERHPQNFLEYRIPLIICVMTSWLHLYFYLMGFQKTGLFVLTLSRIIARDVPYFLRFYVISLFAFASAISLLGNTGNYHTDFSFMRFIKTLWTLIQESVNRAASDDQTNLLLVPRDMQWLSDIWNTLFYYGVGLIMLNLLIAIINSTYSFYTSYNEETQGFNNEAILLIEKFNVMDYIEHHLSLEDLHAYRDKYAMAKLVDDPVAAHIEEMERLDNKKGRKETVKKFKYFFQYTDEILNWSATQVSQNALTNTLHQKSCILLINPQNDYQKGGPCAIPGSEVNSMIIADMIRANKSEIHDIIVTMNCRHLNHISHSEFWCNQKGISPTVGTKISWESVSTRAWMPRDIYLQDWCLLYTKALAAKGRQLEITEKHCIAGSKGVAVERSINEALQAWATQSHRTVSYVLTGQNERTEMFSALEAEVEDPLDNTTAFNADLMSMLRMAEKLIICGSVSSPYVTSTVQDILKYWRGDTSKIIFLQNAPTAAAKVTAFTDFLSKEGIKTLQVESIFHPPEIAAIVQG